MDRARVMKAVIEQLYFGKRPAKTEIQVNGSILTQLRKRGHGWDELHRAVEGLALRRNNGELYGVKPTEPVSLRWVNSKRQILNQVEVCQDAVYRQAPAPGKKGSKPESVANVLGKMGLV